MAAPARTRAQFIAAIAAAPQILADVMVSEIITSWSAAGGGLTNTYKATITQRPSEHSFKNIIAVVVADTTLAAPDGVELFLRTSSSDVNSTANSFFFDKTTNLLYIRIGAGVSPSTYSVSAGFRMYFSTGNGRSPGRTMTSSADSIIYMPLLKSAPVTERELCDPFVGSIASGTSNLVLDASSGRLDAIFRDYVWHYGQVNVYLGGDSMELSDYIPVFAGNVTGKRWTEAELVLECTDAIDATLESIVGTEVVTATLGSDVVAYSGAGDGYGYGYKGAYSNTANLSQTAVAAFPIVGTANVALVPNGTILPITIGRLVTYSPMVLTRQTTNVNAHTAIVNLSDLGIESAADVDQVYVNGSTNGVSWWVAVDRGWLAVMLSLAAPGAPASLTTGTGITVTFNASNGNPAQVVRRVCATLRETTAGVGAPIDLSDDTSISFTGGGGSLPGAIDYGASISRSLYYYASYSEPFPPTSNPINPSGRTRPIYSGTQTNAVPVIALGRAFGVAYTMSANAYGDVILCLGETYVSVSAVRVMRSGSYSSTNVKWSLNAATGFVFVRFAIDANVQYSFQVDFVAPTLADEQVVNPTGPLLLVNDAVLTQAETDYSTSDMELGLIIEDRTVIRDLLAKVVRDAVGLFYVDASGLVCFRMYSPDTTDEFDLIPSYIKTEIEVEEKSERLYRSVIVEWGFAETRTPYQYVNEQVGIARSGAVLNKRTSDYFCSETSHQAQNGAIAMARRLAIMLSLGAPVYRFRASKQCFDLEPGDRVYLENPRLPTSAAYIRGYVSYVKLDLDSMEVELEVTENLVSDMIGDW